MATVTGMTAAAMEAIRDASVVDGEIDGSGHLILERYDTSTIDAGSIYPTIPTLVAALLDYFHPVGDIKMTVVNTNPGTIIGGTWVAWGTGRTPVGVDTGQTEFDTVEETGGEKTHQLTSAEMPSHGHAQNSHNHTQNSHSHTQDSHNHTQNAHTHTQNAHTHAMSTGSIGVLSYDGGTTPNFSVDGGVTYTFAAGGVPANATATNQNTTPTNNAATATNQSTTATNNSATATNQNTGGDGAHNNLQPYITCYFWKRTA